MSLLAQTETTDGPGITDNLVLDQYEIPFGDWIDQAVDWITTRMTTVLDAIVWPFDQLIGWIVRDFLVDTSWVVIVILMGILATLVRNIKVGTFVMVSLTICGLLGNAYWIETARTIGFIAVAVFFCVLIGIPVGVLCGRFDGAWQVIRPVLDAMQVVHSFVYMLPVIYFWGIGEVSATMVTMVFAIPPLIRLTNLGIRQVPEDVVEAARAYGSTELKVLIDVQLPLARPAIMTGINQTLLLAISMLGIAAIMGAGGLGRLMFRALSNQNVPLAASSGLAFFLVAVVLDRMSQREDDDGGNLFSRITSAWAHRRDPETLIPDGEEAPTVVDDGRPVDVFSPVSDTERVAMVVTAAGALVAVVGVLLPWTSDAGKFSAYSRRVDEDLSGSTFSGLDASGGSWFGIIVLAMALFAIGAALKPLRWPGRGPRWLTADGAAIASLVVLIVSLAHLVGAKADLALDPGVGIGVILAMVGGVVASAAAIYWSRLAPHSALRPLAAEVAWVRVGLVGFATLVLFGAMFAGWSFDERQDVVITPELQAEIEELEQKAKDNPADAGPIAAELSALMASAQQSGVIVTDGLSDSGARFGLWTFIGGIAALLTSIPAAGILGLDEHRQWRWSTITAGIGAGVAGASMGWIMTLVRASDPNYVSGIGAFLAMCSGLIIVSSTMRIMREFRRSRVYDEIVLNETMADETATELVDSLV
ncbi:MAG: ABC transporter permease subunit [Actinomycetia bacterium]|nr:ABC transporter permease subunit [Actinomycetes bacterium]MCP4226782.1 ABC transporter permease subunit [Actinomycetes bacterium]MCP5030160.1 ABC transporter permease subunit [Actinomycetes bacterium]